MHPEGGVVFLTHRIEEITAQATDTRRVIGQFILQERAHLSDYTIADIARETFASKASVTRFAKSLGYEGWRDFIRDFMAEVRYEASHAAAVDPNFPFAAGDPDEKIINAVADVAYDSISDTLRLLNRGALALAVRYLQAAESIWVFGLSPNTYLGSLFCRKMLSVGKSAHVAQSGERGLVARSLGPHDCAIIISYSGNNPDYDPMLHIPMLKERRVPLIGITGEGDNYIRKNIRCTLTISSRENLYSKIATFGTEASIEFILNALFSCYFARDFQRNLDFKINSGRELEQRRITAPGAAFER